MYNYELNVEYICNGQIMEQFEMVRPAVDNTPEILKTALHAALSEMLKEVPGMELEDVVYTEQSRHLIKYHLSNGNYIDIFVKVVPVPHVKLEVPDILDDEEIEVQVALFATVKVGRLAFSQNPGKALGRAINRKRHKLTGEGYVNQEELEETGVTFHPAVEVHNTSIYYEGDE